MKAISNFLRKVSSASRLFGFDAGVFWGSLRGLRPFLRDYAELKRQARQTEPLFAMGKLYPCLGDRFHAAGTASGAYFFQDLVVSRKIFARQPRRHVDIGSRIDGFVAHVASFREIEVFDIRPVEARIPNVRFVQADFMAGLEHLESCCDSISSLHALEHFGLGRYNDPVDYNGYLKGLDNIYTMLEPGGTFYFSTPLGPQRIEFNSQRVFSLAYLLNLFRDRYELRSFCYVNDAGELVPEVEISPESIRSNCGCTYGCAIFELEKKLEP